jgi:hypothetical protein
MQRMVRGAALGSSLGTYHRLEQPEESEAHFRFLSETVGPLAKHRGIGRARGDTPEAVGSSADRPGRDRTGRAPTQIRLPARRA